MARIRDADTVSIESRMSGSSRTLSKLDPVSSFNRTVNIYCAEDARNGTSANRELWSSRKYLIGCAHRHEWLNRFPVLTRLRPSNGVPCLARRCPWWEPQIRLDLLDRIRVRQLYLAHSASCEGPSDLEGHDIFQVTLNIRHLSFLAFASKLHVCRLASSHLGHASINVKLCARDIACIIGCEK